MSEGHHEPVPGFSGERRDIVKRVAPEVTAAQKLQLVRVDDNQAHFIDAKGRPWYFDSKKREWREMTPRDIHPMALQFTLPKKLEQTRFDSIDDAARYVFGIHCRSRVVLWQSIADDPEIEDVERVAAKQFVAMYEDIVRALADIDRTTDAAEKEKRKDIFLEAVKRFDEKMNQMNEEDRAAKVE